MSRFEEVDVNTLCQDIGKPMNIHYSSIFPFDAHLPKTWNVENPEGVTMHSRIISAGDGPRSINGESDHWGINTLTRKELERENDDEGDDLIKTLCLPLDIIPNKTSPSGQYSPVLIKTEEWSNGVTAIEIMKGLSDAGKGIRFYGCQKTPKTNPPTKSQDNQLRIVQHKLGLELANSRIVIYLKKITFSQRLTYLKQLIEQTHFLAQNGYAQGDIRDHNMMFDFLENKVYLIDYGAARILSRYEEENNTPPVYFTSPEDILSLFKAMFNNDRLLFERIAEFNDDLERTKKTHKIDEKNR